MPAAPFTGPAAYSRGCLEFRGRTFLVDRRVYLTDPELNHLVDAVVQRGRALARSLGRAPVLAEFGLGCGSLAISVKAELPEAVVIGLEIDPGALEVARANIARHRVDIQALSSDGFAAWPHLSGPDLIFGDPPWGDASTVYEGDRPIEHYLAMPRHSVFPPQGGRTGCHRQVLREARERGWSCEILLNAGVLDADDLGPLGALADECSFPHPAAGLTLVHARLVPRPAP